MAKTNQKTANAVGLLPKALCAHGYYGELSEVITVTI